MSSIIICYHDNNIVCSNFSSEIIHFLETISFDKPTARLDNTKYIYCKFINTIRFNFLRTFFIFFATTTQTRRDENTKNEDYDEYCHVINVLRNLFLKPQKQCFVLVIIVIQ